MVSEEGAFSQSPSISPMEAFLLFVFVSQRARASPAIRFLFRYPPPCQARISFFFQFKVLVKIPPRLTRGS